MLLKLNAYPTFNVLNVYLGVAPLRDALPAEEVSAGRGGGGPRPDPHPEGHRGPEDEEKHGGRGRHSERERSGLSGARRPPLEGCGGGPQLQA